MLQQAFKFAAPPSYAAQDFILSEANAEAARFLGAWPPHPQSPAVLISGPEACGKTHLAACWAERTQAVCIGRQTIGTASSEHLWRGASHAVLEDIHSGIDETALFHMLRHAETQGLFLLLTSGVRAKQLPFTLPDLRSRLLALPAAVIHAPDEALLKAYLFKCFADHQLRVNEEVITYCVRRMERSFVAAHALAEALEAYALENRREITIPVVKNILQ